MTMAQAGTGKRRSFYADLDRLRTQFDSLDQDRTGYIGYSELKQLVEKMSDIEDAVLPELMKKLDRDEDGKVSFEDFQAVFEVERESMKKKKMKIASSESPSSQLKRDPKSPVRTGTGRRLPEIPPTVVLRSKPGRSHPGSKDFGHLSPIHTGTGRSRPPSSDFTETGGMQYLMSRPMDTTDSASPQLKRSSKVLSIFVDSEDVLEGIGDGLHLDSTNNFPSPPMSPSKGHEEVSHVVGILESVCGREVNKEAIAKLCTHLEADQQEEQELLALLSFLDKKNVGSVSVEEFARGLQDCKNAAEVASTPFKSPEPLPYSRRHTIATETVPRLSESFSTPVHHSGVRQSSTPLASTPLHQPAYSNLVLSVLDPDNSGYVRVDSLAQQIQAMGVEADHNSSLEEALAEAVTVNPSGLVNVSEFTNSLDGAVLTEGKTNNFLRQIALRSYHSEIHSLRFQVLQISMERDNLQANLSRTQDENKKLVQMGEEQVDLVTQQSEQKLKTQEDELTQRLRETERTRREEQFQIEDRYSEVLDELQQKLDQVKIEEERLRADLKLAHEEIALNTHDLSKAHNELSKKDSLISLLQRDIESRSDHDLMAEDQHTRIQDLETDLAQKGAIIKDLEEKLRETQDRFDLLYADNEKMKQKYLTAKRDIQRRRTRKSSADRPGHGYGRIQKPRRPLSGSHFGRSSPIKPRIFKSPLDLAISAEENHPVLYEDMDDGPVSDHSEHDEHAPVFSPTQEEMVETEIMPEEVPAEVAQVAEDAGEVATTSSTTSPEGDSDEEDGVYSRSSASLMEEIQKQEQKSLLQSKIKQLEDERHQLQVRYQQLEQQLREAEEEDKKVLLRELESTRQKQEELDRLIVALGKQSRKLNKTRMEIDSRLQVAEQNLASQLQGLRNSLTENSGAESTGNLSDLIEELDSMRTKLQKQRESHEQDITNLKQQLSQAEETSYTQLDQSLRLEEEKAQAQQTVASLELELMSERSGHEAEVNILMQKLDNAEQKIARLERKEQQNVMELREELEHTRDEVERYKQQTEKLRNQLAEAQEKLKSTEEQQNVKEEQVLQAEPAVELSPLMEELESLQRKLTESQAEVKQLRASNSEHLAQTEKLLTELEERSKQADEKMAAKMGQFQEEMESSRLEYEARLGNVSTELRESHCREVDLKSRLSQVQAECENSLSQVKEVSEREANHLKCIQQLEESESSHRQEITNLQADINKYQEELAQLHTAQEMNTVSDISAQPPHRESPRRGEDEPDFIPAPVYDPTKLSYTSTQDPHERIIGQMKGQLDALQRILQAKSGKREGDRDITLVQELIASNAALEKELLQIKKTFDEEQQKLCEMLSDKDKTLTELQLKALDERAALRSTALSTTQKIVSFISTFKGTSDESLSDYQVRVEEAATKLAYIRQLLVERNSKHVNTLDRMMSDLRNSREESDVYKQEIERLKQELDTSQRESSSRQPQAEADQRVDAESGQILHSAVEPETPDSRESVLLVQREEEIHNLKDELEKIRRLERQARSRSEQAECQLNNKERQIAERDEALSSQLKRIEELEAQLQEPVHERVESVVQYVEVQPLEGVNEALLLNMNQDSRERLTISSQIPVEQTPPVPSTEPDREQLAADLEAAEQRLEAFQQIQRTLEMQHQQAIQDIQSKYEAELSVTNEVIEEHTSDLRDLYRSMMGEEGVKDEVGRLSHSQLVREIEKEVQRLKSELAGEQALVNEMEVTMTRKIAEHDQLEAQIQTEHDEEVKALHQQKQQLARQLEDTKKHYHQLAKEQDQHNNVQFQELMSANSDLERQLRQKTEESLILYQRLADLKEEKRVLIDIIEHLCGEAGKLIDVV